MNYSERDQERFWQKVDKSGECWLWTAGEKGRGKGGAFYVGRYQTGKSSGQSRYRAAHHVAYELATGETVTSKDRILQTCDRVMCVRPEHLYRLADDMPHGEERTYRRGCRCDECVEAQRAVKRERYRRRNPRRPRQVDFHGTRSRYAAGCRCQECKDANVLAQNLGNADRHRRMVAGEVNPPHGDTSTYSNYLCRCEPCRAAWSVHMRETAERRKQRRAS